MCVYLGARFQVCSIILTSFRQRDKREGGNFTLPPPPTLERTPKKPTQIRVKKNNWTLNNTGQEQAMRTNNIKAKVENKETVKEEWVEKLWMLIIC